MHTFVGVFWRVGTTNRTVAFCVVALEWTYITLFVGLSAGLHRSQNDDYVVRQYGHSDSIARILTLSRFYRLPPR